MDLALKISLFAASAPVTAAILNIIYQLRNLKETQLYEALKRSGDKDSAPARASASALIAAVGSSPGLLILTRPHRSIAINHLSTALQLESNPVVLITLQDALHRLAKDSPLLVSRALATTNVRIHSSLAHVIKSSQRHAQAHPPKEQQILEGHSLGYNHDTITHLIEIWHKEAKRRPHLPPNQYAPESLPPIGTIVNQLRSSGIALSLALEHSPEFKKDTHSLCYVFMANQEISKIRVKNTIMHDACFDDSTVLNSEFTHNYMANSRFRRADIQSCIFDGSNLSGSDMRGAKFTKASLKETNLSDCNLEDTDLRSADFSGAILSGSNIRSARLWKSNLISASNLSGVNWWAASFYGPDPAQEIDVDLITALSKKHQQPSSMEDWHPSVVAALNKPPGASASVKENG
ncbi:pentapeptide repeat-containing protein [Corallococcus exiguus]|uniref:pentapeptide repeat-containing protein n=1 Tax=Corallococcus exiguus TaxID=83462 RepID=UPI00155FB25B|nr:pentapeptide repeat-containing protein [Corallococcus exiguus]NRD63015.1 pentapeptide repeat-containing protein [Corallococcus exiguus]